MLGLAAVFAALLLTACRANLDGTWVNNVGTFTSYTFQGNNVTWTIVEDHGYECFTCGQLIHSREEHGTFTITSTEIEFSWMWTENVHYDGTRCERGVFENPVVIPRSFLRSSDTIEINGNPYIRQ